MRGRELKLAIYHGYELTGSGSNEYTRYLTRSLAAAGHEVALICADPEPVTHPFVSRAVEYSTAGRPCELFRRDTPFLGSVTLHRLPSSGCLPVYVKDKQRPGHVKAFPEMTDAELAAYHRVQLEVVLRAVEADRPSLLHANHLVYQPVIAAEVRRRTGLPFYVVPHGSSIEYTIREDPRFHELARRGLEACSGVVWIAGELQDRVAKLYPELAASLAAKSLRVGVGTDTTLFRPLEHGSRQSAAARLAEAHPRGGKTAAQREALRRGLERGELEITRQFWEAYDHRLPDDDIPERLDSIPWEGRLLIFVGSLTWGKGVQSLIAAMPGVLARHPDVHLVVVGSGTYREVLEALAMSLERGWFERFESLVRHGRDLERDDASGPLEDLLAYASTRIGRSALEAHGDKLAGRVHFLGRLDHPRLKQVFPCASLGVFPSIVKEASPLVFLESMANGVLPCGAYHSGLRDGLDDLREHLPERLWRAMKLPAEPERRVQGLVEHLDLLLSLTKSDSWTPRLRRLAEERYDWRAVTGRLVEAVTPLADPLANAHLT